MESLHERKYWIRFGALGLVVVIFLAAYFSLLLLRPVSGDASGSASMVRFTIDPGDGFREVINLLSTHHLIRSQLVTTVYLIGTGKAFSLKPGAYALTAALSTREIIDILVGGLGQEVEVVIYEGITSYDIDEILGTHGVIIPGTFAAHVEMQGLEGVLFPDTYRFFVGSSIDEVMEKFSENFTKKAEVLLGAEPENYSDNLILASLLEKEVPDFEERKVVAGIFKKRLSEGMPLQVDATLCYIKIQGGNKSGCNPITEEDLEIDSPYNTYVYAGLPPGPISNPGEEAIMAVLMSEKSPYWFYLSDLATGKTIFSRTFEEHKQNKERYLR